MAAFSTVGSASSPEESKTPAPKAAKADPKAKAAATRRRRTTTTKKPTAKE